jgi:hypothetical protein
MSIQSESIQLTTNGAGNASGSSLRPVNGLLSGISISLGTISAGSVWTITESDSALPLLTATVAASGTFYPRSGAVDPTGTPIPNSFPPLPLTGKVAVSVSGGGASHAGSLVYWWMTE